MTNINKHKKQGIVDKGFGRKFHVYALLLSDNKIYIGMTAQIINRIRSHLLGKGGANETKRNYPIKIIYLQRLNDRVSAIWWESELIKKVNKDQDSFLIQCINKFGERKNLPWAPWLRIIHSNDYAMTKVFRDFGLKGV